jgi:hypothetical protein
VAEVHHPTCARATGVKFAKTSNAPGAKTTNMTPTKATAAEATHMAATKAAHVATATTTVSAAAAAAAAAGLRARGKKAAGKHRTRKNHHHSFSHDFSPFDWTDCPPQGSTGVGLSQQDKRHVAIYGRWDFLFVVSIKFPFNHPDRVFPGAYKQRRVCARSKESKRSEVRVAISATLLGRAAILSRKPCSLTATDTMRPGQI